jgi:hypothetical protein
MAGRKNNTADKSNNKKISHNKDLVGKDAFLIEMFDEKHPFRVTVKVHSPIP